jgi:putative signal transducing protein
MAKEKADSDKGSWFARWRERRKRNKLRASEMSPTDELVAVEVAGSQPEAEMICSLLRSAGIACMPRLTSRGAGAGDGLGTGGQHEIMVRSKDAQAARKILRRPGLTNRLVTFT